MKLYVCWNTHPGPGRGRHPCGVAHAALVEHGHRPEVVKARGAGFLPDGLANRSAGRRAVRELTGRSTVPVLVTDDGEVVTESARIAAWAAAHPAGDGPS